MFVSRPTSESHETKDDVSRLWPDWHEYTIGSDNIPVLGKRVLFHPKRKPNLVKHRLCTDTVLLSSSNCFLLGPISFEARHDILNPCNFVGRIHWEHLLTLCSARGIVPPSLSNPDILATQVIVSKPMRVAPIQSTAGTRKSTRLL